VVSLGRFSSANVAARASSLPLLPLVYYIIYGTLKTYIRRVWESFKEGPHISVSELTKGTLSRSIEYVRYMIGTESVSVGVFVPSCADR
jgi:hypothetical protein